MRFLLFVLLPWIAYARPIIIDTDGGLGDAMAILYLLKIKGIDVEAITVTGDGVAHSEAAVRNVLGLVQLGGKPQIPVAFGATTSMSFVGAFPSRARREADQMGGVPLPQSAQSPVSLKAEDLIIQVAETSLDKVTLLALGPLTNVAQALLKNPGLVDRIAAIYIQGGALNVPGNLPEKIRGYENTAAEINICLDAKAAEIVLTSGIPIVLIPLDASGALPSPEVLSAALEQQPRTPVSDFVYRLLALPTLTLAEPLAATLLVHANLGEADVFPLKVVQAKSKEYGRTQVSPAGTPTTVYLRVDGEGFSAKFLNAIERPTL